MIKYAFDMGSYFDFQEIAKKAATGRLLDLPVTRRPVSFVMNITNERIETAISVSG